MDDIVKAMKYTDTTESKIGQYFIGRMNRVVKEYKEKINNFNYQFSIFSRDLPVTIIEIGISEVVRARADSKLNGLIGDLSNLIELDDNQVEYTLNNDNAEEGIVGSIMEEYGVEPSEDEAKDPEFPKTKQTQLLNLLISNNGKINSIFNRLRDNAKKIGYNFYTSEDNQYENIFKEAVDLFIEKHNNLIEILEGVDIDLITSQAKKDISQLFVCGEQLEVPDIEAPDYAKDPDNRTYSQVNDESDITSREYWVEFTKYLNINALLPIYWRIGIILPTPAGPLKIPLPIISIHLITIRIFSVIIVIWLTINGLVIVPVVYTIQFLPIADASSVWLILFRGANKKVKDKTGVEVLNIPIVGGINVNPELSKILPFKKDDLPTIERMGITNPLFLLYLNQMLQKMTPSMGLP